jgi:type II secretory pathway pseudopilin PulG
MSMRRQRGITLILSLIMLVLLTIMALASFNIGKSSLQVVGNAQQQGQVLNAAQTMVNQAISSPAFAESPGTALDNSNCPTGYGAPANSRCVDLYGDGKTVILVALTPQPACVQAKRVPPSSLNLTANPRSPDWGCIVQEKQNHAIESLEPADSLCADSIWEINAEATERVSGAKATVTQGVNLRVSMDAVETACPIP